MSEHAEETNGLPPDEYKVPTEVYAAVIAARGELMIGLINRIENGKEELCLQEQVGVLRILQEAVDIRFESRKKITELQGDLAKAREAMLTYSNQIARVCVELRSCAK